MEHKETLLLDNVQEKGAQNGQPGYIDYAMAG